MHHRIFLLVGILCLVFSSSSFAQSPTQFGLNAPYSTVRGHFAFPKYKWRVKKNEYGKRYSVAELQRVKYKASPPVNGQAYAEVLAGNGFNPFLYQATTGGVQAGVSSFTQHGGFFLQVAAHYDHTLPSQAVAASPYPFALRARLQTGAFLRWAHYNSTTNRGGMFLLDGLVTAQTDAHVEAGLAYFFFPKMSIGTSRFGGWNRNLHNTGESRRSQWVNLPSSYLFHKAVGIEIRGTNAFWSQGIMPYAELVTKGISAQLHYIRYAGNDGWGLIEDLFSPRWVRTHLTAGYSHIPRVISFPGDVDSGWSLEHTLQMAFVDASATISFAPFYRPMEMTLGGTLRFMDTLRYVEENGTLVLTELQIPEGLYQVYARFRITSNQI